MLHRPLIALALSSVLTACPTQRTDVSEENPNNLEDAPPLPEPANANAKPAPAPVQQPNAPTVQHDPNHHLPAPTHAEAVPHNPNHKGH